MKVQCNQAHRCEDKYCEHFYSHEKDSDKDVMGVCTKWCDCEFVSEAVGYPIKVRCTVPQQIGKG